MLIFNEIPTAFPWYDKREKQDIYKENCDFNCNYKLITPYNALLPFEFSRPTTGETITAWQIFYQDDSAAIDLTAAKSAVHTVIANGLRYFYYNGSAISGLILPAGYYYSVITFNNGLKQYSETFAVPFDSFALGAPNKYLKLEWYSTRSILPYYYGETVNGIPYFRNVTYLDTFIGWDEPEIQEETVADGNNNEIPVFQKAIIRYRIPHAVSNYLKNALVIMQMHDVINLTTANGVHSGQIARLTTATAPLDTGCLSTIDILFEQDLAIVKGACS